MNPDRDILPKLEPPHMMMVELRNGATIPIPMTLVHYAFGITVYKIIPGRN